MRDKEIFSLKIFWRKSIASLHHLTQDMQLANVRRTAGDSTWVLFYSRTLWRSGPRPGRTDTNVEKTKQK